MLGSALRADIPLVQFQPTPGQPLALVMGNEVFGGGDEALALCDAAVEASLFGTKHSLNVSIAADAGL